MTALGDASPVTSSLALIYATKWSDAVSDVLFAPAGCGTQFTVEDAYELAGSCLDDDLLDSLLPLCLVDERSIACVVIGTDLPGRVAGDVVRLHLNKVAAHHQLHLLDVDPVFYVHSLEQELKAREPGLRRVLDVVGPAYQESYLVEEKEKKPRDFVVRPVRIACQNVIVALGAIAQDSTFDGLSVVAWQTCEVPHVATHEANRALAALMLADAFQNGGTMEIRFDRTAKVVFGEEVVELAGHPEHAVPASLRRFARTVGVVLGVHDPAAIQPSEARALFLAVTPMPDSLRGRVDEAVAKRGITPERLCFTLLSQTWREVELDFLLACSARAGSVLEGGADWQDRSARQAEMEVCRAALMIGMLWRRMNGRDSAGVTDGVRVVEDVSVGVGWDVLDDDGAVTFTGLDAADGVPWTTAFEGHAIRTLTVFPRSSITRDTVDRINSRAARGEQVAVAVPRDARVPEGLIAAPVLRCPDRIANLDQQAENRLLTARIARA